MATRAERQQFRWERQFYCADGFVVPSPRPGTGDLGSQSDLEVPTQRLGPESGIEAERRPIEPKISGGSMASVARVGVMLVSLRALQRSGLLAIPATLVYALAIGGMGTVSLGIPFALSLLLALVTVVVLPRALASAVARKGRVAVVLAIAWVLAVVSHWSPLALIL